MNGITTAKEITADLMQITESTMFIHAESWQCAGEQLRLTDVTVWLWPFTVT